MGNFINPTNKVVAKGTADEQVLTVTGTVTECKPGRLVKKGADDAKVIIGAADGLTIGWLGFEQTGYTFKPANISTAYVVNDEATVISGAGIHVIAYGSAAIAKGARVAAGADGKVITFADGTMTPDLIVGIAEETTAGAGNVRIRSLI
jgi:hypothetical protein